jgi:hypothetical protein
MRILICILFALLATGCINSNIKPFVVEQAKTRHVVEKYPEEGITSTATVGSSLVRVKDYFVSTQDIPKLVVVTTNVSGAEAGTTVNIEGTKNIGGVEYYLVWCIGLNDVMTADGCMAVDMNSLTSAGRWIQGFGISEKFAGIQFDKTASEKVSVTQGYTNYEILYSGVQGDVLRLRYREYSPENLARAAFTQDLTYSLADKVIQFRSVEIEVHEANNRTMKYVVTKY